MLHFRDEDLRPVFERMREHLREQMPTRAESVYRVPVSTYVDHDRWSAEIDKIFRRKPMPLALSGELRSPGMYRALTVVGIPVIIVRGAAGKVRAYVNACRHRGMRLVADGDGRANRFTCGYHAWTYAVDDGRLLAIPDAESFGDPEKGCLGLVELAVEERHGLIWVVLTPGVPLDLDSWLGSMEPLLAKMALEQCEIFTSASFIGPNWKLSMEGYLETYHFPMLHPKTFNPVIFGNMNLIDLFGSHLRLCTPMRSMSDLLSRNCDELDTLQYLQHSFWLFPSLQISFTVSPPGPERMFMALMSQIFPGDAPDKSVTIQRIITTRNVRGTDMEATVQAFADFAFSTVRNEDYPATMKVQETLCSGAIKEFVIGRNEIGIQHLQRSLEKYLAA